MNRQKENTMNNKFVECGRAFYHKAHMKSNLEKTVQPCKLDGGVAWGTDPVV